MVNLVSFIARVTDGMMLVATMDNAFDVAEYSNHAKRIIKTLNSTSPSRCTIEAGPYYFQLAFQYLEELHKDFEQNFGNEVPKYSRPYAAVQFDPKMNRIRRDFIDPRSQKNMQKLSSDLNEIHGIMMANINDIVSRGEKLDKIQDMSHNLVSDSKKYHKFSKYVNLQSLLRTLGPVIAVVLVIIFVIYWRFF